MLWFTRYLWIIMAIVLAAGPWYPALGFIVPVVFAAAFVSGITRGRWMCGNLCPRGSFNDFVLDRLSRRQKVPEILSSMWLRIPVIALMMGFMAYRLVETQGALNKLGMVFVTMCWITTIIAVFLGVGLNPRAWCVFCPMGTLQNILGRGKSKVAVDKSICVDCEKCVNACPMNLDCRDADKDDCILCERCVLACPKKALS